MCERKLGFVAVVVVVVMAGAAGVSADTTQYALALLGDIGYPYTEPTAMNNSGWVVGAATLASGDRQAFLYPPGGPIKALGNLGPTPAFTSGAFAVNNSGQIVGQSFTTASIHPFLYTGNGPMQDLGFLGYGYGINDLGQVVGAAFTSNSSPWYAFLYNISDGSRLNLGTLGGQNSEARAINNLGQVVGRALRSDGKERAFLYAGNGPMQDLGTLGGEGSWAQAINDAGQVVGWADTTDNASKAFIWNGSGALQDLGCPGVQSRAYDINNRGQVVGWYLVGGRNAPFLCNGSDAPIDLNTLISPPPGLVLDRATGINDLGQITGVGRFTGTNTFVGFLLTPVPEPGSLALLALGSLAVIRKRRK